MVMNSSEQLRSLMDDAVESAVVETGRNLPDNQMSFDRNEMLKIATEVGQRAVEAFIDSSSHPNEITTTDEEGEQNV